LVATTVANQNIFILSDEQITDPLDSALAHLN